ncbi:MAG: NBR1-Ig-like domain-containing protein [Patescibacteria group bacterium]
MLQSVPAASAAVEPYQAEVSAGSATLTAGQTKVITLKFKNIGTKTWVAGQNATAVYLYGSSSVFGHTTWLKDDLPAVITPASVKPGSMASATFTVRAPATPGTYQERFLLSYGTNAWIKGSVVTVTFTVAKPSIAIPAVTTATTAPETVSASTPWKATLTDRGGIEWQVDPGEHIVVDLKFKNAGTKTWVRTGTGYISLYTWGPKYRTSPFKDYSWKTASQAAPLVESEVKPGQIGTIRLELRAPEVPGSYQESFQLAAEDAAWLDGGSVTLPISVRVPDSYIAKGVTPGGITSPTGSYNTILLLTSNKSVTLTGDGRIDMTHGFKNEGTATWNTLSLSYVGISPSLGTLSSVRDDSWPSASEAVRMPATTAPGQIGFVKFALKAPVKKGVYTVSFKLMADGQEVEGGDVDIPVTVTSDGYVDPTPIPVPTPSASGGIVNALPLTGDISTLPAEPIIRVGLYKTTDDTLPVRGVSTGMTVTQNGATICTLSQGQIATVVYSRTTRNYTLSGPGCSGQSTGWYVFVATDGISPLEITDYSRPVSWLPGANDNTFRGKLELRYAPATDAVWAINELPIESYLKGIAETSNVSPLEYQKALLTAARTYAMYHVNRGTKHADEFFIVDAHLDQVYRGYGQEARSPNIVSGVESTRGQIVTYDGKLAITPYFSRSDGRTRSWTEVWYGTGFPWLVSVPVPWDEGQTLWGHGVGLSARGALYMASKDNATYDAILKHFYQNTELRRAYK